MFWNCLIGLVGVLIFITQTAVCDCGCGCGGGRSYTPSEETPIQPLPPLNFFTPPQENCEPFVIRPKPLPKPCEPKIAYQPECTLPQQPPVQPAWRCRKSFNRPCCVPQQEQQRPCFGVQRPRPCCAQQQPPRVCCSGPIIEPLSQVQFEQPQPSFLSSLLCRRPLRRKCNKLAYPSLLHRTFSNQMQCPCSRCC